jgi:FAD/FMN-containing dehydrogenase
VLADGEMLRTGSHPIPNGSPFFRWYGPDLTGLFTGDAGALGIKARITLRLIRQPAHFGAASFGFTEFESMAAGMSEAAREGVVADNYGLDPKLQQGQLGGASAADAFKAVWAVLKTSTNPLDGLLRVFKMALAGKRFIDGYDYSAHYVVEGASRAEVRAKLAQVRGAMAGHGTEIANTIPTVLRAAPFIPLYPILGPKGERWACMHGIMPFSKVAELHRKISALFAEHAEAMQRHRVHMGGMFTTISTHAFLYEPVFYWQDDRTIFHRRYLPAEYLATLPEYEANPQGRELVRQLRKGIVECYVSVGAIHLQIGKCYPYTVGREEQAMRVLNDVKRSLDPQGLMNPGALGL